MQPEVHSEDLENDSILDTEKQSTVVCPNCKNNVPPSLYCLVCRCPMELDQDDHEVSYEDRESEFDIEHLRKIQAESSTVPKVEELPEPNEENKLQEGVDYVLTPVEEEPSRDMNVEMVDEDPIMEEEFDMVDEEPIMEEEVVEINSDFDFDADVPPDLDDSFNEPEYIIEESLYDVDPLIKELAKNLFNAIYLELWSVNLLNKGIDEAQFNRVFKVYQDRTRKFMEQRKCMLNQVQDLDFMEKKVKEAKVGLEELDVRKTLGELHIGEYEALGPAYQWTIKHYEQEVETRRKRVDNLKNLTSIFKQEKVEEIKSMAEDSKKLIESPEIFILSLDTKREVKNSINEILLFLDNQ